MDLTREVHAVANSEAVGFIFHHFGGAATSQLLVPQIPEEGEGEVPARVSTLCHISKGLILAQNERWRRGLGMQVERAARPVAQG